MEKFNEDFIKDTAKMFADMQSDDIKLNYKDGVYYGYIEGFKKALELVKNNGVLDAVINRKYLMKVLAETRTIDGLWLRDELVKIANGL